MHSDTVHSMLMLAYCPRRSSNKKGAGEKPSANKPAMQE